MKITFDVDMTPQEARQFMGLPDVQPLQAVAMAELEKRMKVEMDRISPEGLVRTWFVDAPQTADRMLKMFTGLMSAAVPRATPAEPPKPAAPAATATAPPSGASAQEVAPEHPPVARPDGPGPEGSIHAKE